MYALEIGPVVRGVGKRIGAGKILDIGGAEAGRRVVETDSADKAKLGGAVGETGGRDMIAEYPVRQASRLGSGVISSSDSSTFWSSSSRGRNIIRCSPNATGC